MSEPTPQPLPPSPHWWWNRFVGFDTETTGLNTDKDRIVSAAIVCVSGNAPAANYEWLINPGIEIPAAATAVHGITTERIRDEGLSPAVVIPDIIGKLQAVWAAGAPVVIFNSAYDLGMLRAEAARLAIRFTVDGPVVDPMIMDRLTDPQQKRRHRLIDCCAFHKIQHERAHNAAADALAAARLAWWLCEKYDQFRGLSAVELHRLQASNRKGWPL